MPSSTGRQIVTKPEQIEMLSSDKDLHFTGAIALNAQETESIPGLLSNKITIKGVNAQSIQFLKYRLIFWGGSGFNNTDLNADPFVSDVVLDFTDTLSAFRIGSANHYYLDVGGLDIPLDTSLKTLYCSLMNMSSVAKIAGALGAVQIDVKYSLRL